MLLQKRTTTLGWLTLIACAVCLLVSTQVSSAYAQTSSSVTKSSGTLEGEGGTDAGDPDMPGGDVPPPSSSGTNSSSDGNLTRGHGMTGGITEAVPSKRLGQWAHWKVALKLLARGFYLR